MLLNLVTKKTTRPEGNDQTKTQHSIYTIGSTWLENYKLIISFLRDYLALTQFRRYPIWEVLKVADWPLLRHGSFFIGLQMFVQFKIF